MLKKADMDTVREKSLKEIKTYKVIKNLIWQCSTMFDLEGNEIPSEVQLVDI